YDANNLTTELYNSGTNAGDAPGYGIKFTSPIVANGKVYIGTAHDLATATNPQGELDVYGSKKHLECHENTLGGPLLSRFFLRKGGILQVSADPTPDPFLAYLSGVAAVGLTVIALATYRAPSKSAVTITSVPSRRSRLTGKRAESKNMS